MLLRRTEQYLLMGIERDYSELSLETNQNQSLMGRALLVECLKEWGIFYDFPQYHYNENGKPYLINYSNIYFNITHCKEAVFCAISHQEIGIDAEIIREMDWELAENVLNESELAELRLSSDPKTLFYQYWTKKESLLKYSGCGITENFKNLLTDARHNFQIINMRRYMLCICILEIKD